MKRTVSEHCSHLDTESENFDIPEFMEWLKDSYATYYSKYQRIRLDTYSSEVTIVGEREETDEEYNKRLKDIEDNKEYQKQARYKKYLELKKEFEPQ